MATDKMNIVQQILQLPPRVGSHRAQVQEAPSRVGMHGCHKARALPQQDSVDPCYCRQRRGTSKAILSLENTPFCSSPCLALQPTHTPTPPPHPPLLRGARLALSQTHSVELLDCFLIWREDVRKPVLREVHCCGKKKTVFRKLPSRAETLA